ncbi:Flp pilus assembly protein TadB [Brevibacterium casei]|uniref:Type II secretion system protein n=2 Tax=Brevibacterium casei TaxID=33889 RepID=K9AMK5_9MICO|nr:type II secretion system F family protein [Brevibacterium casei]EKU48628.1 type II secretion system protein [Brevibacterium casei S18]QQT70706.1 type II secretion system F family protein [Brevibacterium casei]VEW14132.1 Flp pilus assembly protein TadB [Brevibacterium casei]
MSYSQLSLLIGACLGAGLLLVWMSLWERKPATRTQRRWVRELDDMLTAAGFPRMHPIHLVLLTLAVLTVVTIVATALTGSWAIALCFGLFASWLPYRYLQHRARSKQVLRRELWPETLDHLNSGVRAGLSLPEALGSLAHRGPEPLRPLFEVFAEEYRASGSFAIALERFRQVAADPVADRIVAALSVTRQVGGSDLGTMLRALAQFVRDDARTRNELSARQQWTVNGARLAVAAPWVVLAFLSTRPETAAAYNSQAGLVLLCAGFAVSLLAYQAMKKIGRLPQEPRVIAGSSLTRSPFPRGPEAGGTA